MNGIEQQAKAYVSPLPTKVMTDQSKRRYKFLEVMTKVMTNQSKRRYKFLENTCTCMLTI